MLLQTKRLIRQVIHRSRETLAYVSFVLMPNSLPHVRVVIFAQGRSGSTLLESLLCSTGHFVENGELLNTELGDIIFPAPFIHGLSRLKRKKGFIFHVKIYQLTRDRKRALDACTFLESLYNEGFKVIFLRRKNVVKQCLSNMVAKKRGGFHKFDDKLENFKVTINCRSFVNRVKERSRFHQEEKAALANIEYHEVVYEDDLELDKAHQKTIDRLLEYLSLDRKESTTRHRKINTLPMDRLIRNYDEFMDCMKKNGWQKNLNQGKQKE